jgi:translocation and assembly module TamB
MKPRSRWLLFGAILIVVSAAAILAGVFMVRSAWFAEKVRERIVRELENATGGQVEIASFRFDWSNLQASVDGLLIHGLEEDGQPPLFEAERITVGLKIISMLRRKVDIALLCVDSPQVNVLVDAEGRTNIPPFRSTGHSTRAPVERFLDLAIGEYMIRHGQFRYADRRVPLDLRGRELDLRMDLERPARAYHGRVATRDLRISEPFASRVELALDTEFRLDSSGVVVPRGRLALERSRIDWRGHLRDFSEPRIEANFQGELQVAEFAAPLRLPIQPAGQVSVKGEAVFASRDDWQVTGTSRFSSLTYRRDDFQAANIEGGGAWMLSPQGLSVDNLEVRANGGHFRGHAGLREWTNLSVEGEVGGFSLEAITSMLGRQKLVWSAAVSGPVIVSARIQSGRWADVSAAADLQLEARKGGIPLRGVLRTEYDMKASTLRFQASYLETPGSRVNFEGDAASELRFGLVSRDLNDFLPALGLAVDEAPERLPVALQQGILQWEGLVTGALTALCIQGKLEAGPLLIEGRRLDRLSAEVRVSSEELSVKQLVAERGATRLQAAASLLLSNWRIVEETPVRGRFNFSGIRVQELMQEADVDVPVAGIVSASGELQGAVGAPQLRVQVRAAPLTAWGEKIDRLTAEVQGNAHQLRVVFFEAVSGAATARGSGEYSPQGESWSSGSLEVRGEARKIQLDAWKFIQNARPGLGGEAAVNFSASLTRASDRFRLRMLNGEASIQNLGHGGRILGDAELRAHTRGSVMSVELQSRFSQGEIRGNAEWSLTGSSFGLGQVVAQRIDFDLLRDIGLLGESDSELPFRGSFDADFGFSGPVLNPRNWTAALKISRIELAPRLKTPPGKSAAAGFVLRNEEPLLAYLDGRGLRVQAARVSGGGTSLEATGTIAFRSRNPWNLQLRGTVSLPVLSLFEPDLVAEGSSHLDASIRGVLNRPQIVGTMELKNASFYLKDLPNGIEKVEGLIRFDRTRAAIEKLTAQTGGGALELTGFVGFGTGELVYRLQAKAQRVRVRYPESVSTTADASLNLTGTSENSLLSGVITVNRIGITPRTDFGALLAQSSGPSPGMVTQSNFLRGMQLDIRVETGGNAELVTSLTRDIQPEARLSVRGTVVRPIVLGTVSANDGEILFFGGQYRITRGEVSFFNPVKIEPVVDLDLETRVRGISVTISVNGPANRLNMSYRSDPPLQPNEIIALLTVGRAPGSVTGVATASGSQSALQSSGNSLLGSALTTPVSGRLQRFFGVSRLRIDPEMTGVSNTPVARLTIEQQLTRDTTVTYITNLNRTQYQIVRVQWDFSRNFSMLAIREENGIFSLGFQYQGRFK